MNSHSDDELNHHNDDEGDDYGEEEFEDDHENEDESPVIEKETQEDVTSDVGGLSLESYMERNFKDITIDGDNNKTPDNALDGEMKPLDGVIPQSSEKEQILLRRKLGYSESADSFSPVKNIIKTSASGLVVGGSSVHNSLAYDSSPPKSSNSKYRAGNVDAEISALYSKISEAAAMKEETANTSDSGAPNGGKKLVEPLSDAANAARVDALLMELFPERMKEDQRRNGSKGTKKGTKQAYGVGAVKDSGGGGGGGNGKPHDIAYYINMQNNNQQQSRYGQASEGQEETSSPNSRLAGGSEVPSVAHLELQLKTVRKELRAKEDKLARVTEHSMMLSGHMDKLKGEVALLTMRLRDADLELAAKDARLEQALKMRKKANKKSLAASEADVGALGHENLRLKEREQALMDAVEELSTQNQDLIVKLKQSMQRELELSSKRAALISSTVANMATGDNMSNYRLPNISGSKQQQGGGGTDHHMYRAQSEPTAGDQGERVTGKRLAKNKSSK